MSKNGRWSNYKGKLEAFLPEADFQKKVEEVKSSFVGLSATELSRVLVMTRNEKRDMEDHIKSYNIELEALSQLLVANLEASEIQKIGLDSGETVFLHSEPFSSIEDRDAVMGFIKKNKLGNLLTLHFKTLNAMVKERLSDGKPAIPGVRVFLKTSARITGGRTNSQDSE